MGFTSVKKENCMLNEQMDDERINSRLRSWRKGAAQMKDLLKTNCSFILSPSTYYVLCTVQSALNTQACTNYERETGQGGKHSPSSPWDGIFPNTILMAPPVFLTLKPCLTAHTQIKTSLFIVSSTLGPCGFFSEEKPVIHLLD